MPVYDSEDDLLVFGFDKPGVFAVELLISSQPGQLAEALDRLRLDGYEVLTAVSQVRASHPTQMVFRFSCGVSQPVSKEQLRRQLEGLFSEEAVQSVAGRDLTHEDVQRYGDRHAPTYSVFISYSSDDRELAENLFGYLSDRGVSCWLDSHEMTAGQHIERTLNAAIENADRFILLCSETSLSSKWVDLELEALFGKEKRTSTPSLLIPIDIDGALRQPAGLSAWCSEIRRRRVASLPQDGLNEDFFLQIFRALMREPHSI